MPISSSRPPRIVPSSGSPRVLIVDENEDSLAVLQTALQIRGVETVTTRHPNEGLELARDFHPDLILLDLESVEAPHDASTRRGYDLAAKRENAPLILVARTKGTKDPVDGPHVVSKPYHYAPLVRKIQELLEPSAQRRAA